MSLPADPVTAVADAVSVLVDDIAKPLLDQSESQAHDTQFLEACQEINDAFALVDPDRARAIAALASRVCIDNGYPTGAVGDEVIEVPVGYLEALLTIAKARVRDTAKLNDLLHALQTK